jgi:nucleotide-binding universal stress UspA family protein
MGSVAVRSILCPVDFSDQSRSALRWGGEFATRFQGRLTVLNVVDPLLDVAARTELGRDLEKETEPLLLEFVATAWDGHEPPAPLVLSTGTGNPPEVILETAAREAADLIVLGTQGLGGVRKWLLGSTTERLLRQTQVPVLAVPPGVTTVAVERLLIATDFSASSSAAVTWAAALAQRFAAALTVLHVVEPLAVPAMWHALAGEAAETRIADARATLAGIKGRLDVPCETVVAIGRPADSIGATADARRASLIVMGLRGDQGILASRPGSIAYRVLGSATMPVLVVPPPRAA